MHGSVHPPRFGTEPIFSWSGAEAIASMVSSGGAARRESRLCPETWGVNASMHRFKILVNMPRLALSQVEQAFVRNAAGGVQRARRRPCRRRRRAAFKAGSGCRRRLMAPEPGRTQAPGDCRHAFPCLDCGQTERRIREKPRPPVRLVQIPFGH